MLKIINITILLFIFSFPMLAQGNYVEGSIVTLKNDTIKGQIDYPEWVFNPKRILFRTDNFTQGKIYTYRDIKAFRILYKNEQYERHIISRHPEPIDATKLRRYSSIDSIDTDYNAIVDTAFLRVLAKGRLNLFELQYNQYQPHYFIQKGKENMIELIRRKVLIQNRDSFSVFTFDNYKNQLSQLTLDCSMKGITFLKLPYQNNDLAKVVKQYNECTKESYYVMKEEQGNRYFSTMLGVMRPRSIIKDPFRNFIYETGVDVRENKTLPILSLSFEQNFNRLNNKLGLGEELNLAFVDVTHKKVVTYSLSDKIFAYSLQSWAIKASGYVRYFFRSGNIQPYIKTGIGMMYYTNPKITLQEITLTPFPFSSESTDAIKRIKPNYLMGLGVKYNTFFLEARYDGWIDKAENSNENLLLRRPAVFVGYSWHLNKKRVK
jgi:hypothetical protein